MNTGRTVYSYRSWKPILKAIGSIILCLVFAAIFADTLRHTEARSMQDPFLKWLMWGALAAYALSVLGTKIWFLLYSISERIIVEDGQLTYFDWLGRKKFTLDISEVSEVKLLFSREWRVVTPKGSFTFTEALRDHADLLHRLRFPKLTA